MQLLHVTGRGPQQHVADEAGTDPVGDRLHYCLRHTLRPCPDGRPVALEDGQS